MQVQFDSEALINDLIKALNIELDKIAQVLIEFMVGEIALIPESGSIEAVGKPDWRQDVIQALKYEAVASAGELVRKVGILDQNNIDLMYKAMIIEFGMGSESSSDNPWLSEYLSSPYYHQERGGMEVYGREGQEVYDIDIGGWRQSTAEHNNEIPYFRQKGSEFFTNIFGNSSTFAETYFNEAIEKAVDSIDFSKYLIIR